MSTDDFGLNHQFQTPQYTRMPLHPVSQDSSPDLLAQYPLLTRSLVFTCNIQRSQEKVGNNSQMTTAPKEWHEIFQDSLWKVMSYFPKSCSYYRFTSDFKNPPAKSYATYLTVVGLEINGLKFQFQLPEENFFQGLMILKHRESTETKESQNHYYLFAFHHIHL